METVIRHLTMKGFTEIETDELRAFRRGKVTVFLGARDCWAVIPLDSFCAGLTFYNYLDVPDRLNHFLNEITQ